MAASRNFTLVGCTALLALVGCSDSDTDKPTDTDYDSVAQALGGVAATNDGGGEVGTLIDVSVIATGAPQAGFDLDASGSFSGTRLGVTYDYDVACADSAGLALTSCSSASDTAKVDVKWSGELATPVLSGKVSRTGTIELSKLQTGTVTIAGSGSLTVDAHFDALLSDATRDYHLSYEATYDDVLVQRTPAKLLGGSVHYALTAERMATNGDNQSSAKFEIEAVLTFDASGAKLTLDGDHSYTVNTSTGVVANLNASTQN